MKVQENQVGLKLNGAHQFVAYAEDMTLLGDNIDTIKENTETLSDVSKDVGLEIKVEEIKYGLLSLVVKALGYKPEGRGFEYRWGEILNLPNPSGRTGPGVYSASIRNESRDILKEKKNVSGE
jgi:hypothetical protein